ncbi:HAMP domain-containing sensor histidine kinase [Mitsuaria sp. GD03876]|uniref:sensor histidine kinase n=1 Tax=Mitsuaria sp. GD03876 TaxID=2975399 RepID=UPI00244B4490|nr:HAMP domain-containing sensor histidine kinase [Mitsuaria sp. GD03876]MDH0864015.1 HAMP domain-containing histidine kinase [Mitsuaria sp. GD03876]
MKLGPVELPALAVPRLGPAAFRRRAVVHLAFLLLALATVGLVLTVLIDQKQRAYQRYAQGFRQSLAEIVLQLRHPSGQLALLNPTMGTGDRDGQAPVLLPFAAIDFDDQNKAQRAVEMAGCGLRWPDGASLCAAVGANAYAGGFLYLVGSLESGPLVGREHGALDLGGVHRARVTLTLRGQTQTWIAPFEGAAASDGSQRGRLTGFAGAGPQLPGKARPVREFRGWLWREGPCAEGSSGPACARRAFYSIRLPVEAFQDALFDGDGRRARPVWPPADLDQARVRVELLGPGAEGEAPPVLFDSARPGASLALSLDRIGAALQPGETLRIERLGPRPQTIAERRGPELSERALPWLIHVMRRLPVQGDILGVGADTDAAEVRWLTAADEVATPSGRYRLELRGDLRSLDRQLALEARPLAWLAAAMLAAVALAWLMVELGLIRGIAVLTKRAAAVSYNMQDARADQRIGELDVADLRGRDELGILAGSLADALSRVKDGLRREQLRAEREREMWHAVGHEIMSPLQSLMLLHGAADDPSHRYVQRMQQAVKVLYGSAPPSEALASADLHPEVLDLVAFCREVAANAHYAGIDDVTFTTALPEPQPVRAEAYALEDAVTHVLRNADRYRPRGTPIALTLEAGEPGTVLLRIRNQGPPIDPAMLEQIFEYGVSDTAPQAAGERRGQGLFVARTYLAKMDGGIQAFNLPDGVVFEMSLRRVTA